MSATAIDASRAGVAIFAVAASGSAPSAFIVPGPTTIVVLGVAVPALSAVLGVIGVVVGQLLAPAGVPLGWRRRSSLMTALIMLELGIVIARFRRPLVAIGHVPVGRGVGKRGAEVGQQSEAANTDNSRSLHGLRNRAAKSWVDRSEIWDVPHCRRFQLCLFHAGKASSG